MTLITVVERCPVGHHDIYFDIFNNDNEDNHFFITEGVKDFWCFISGITRNTEYDELKYFLEKYFGKIKRVDIVRSKVIKKKKNHNNHD